MMSQRQILDLLDKYNKGEATPKEKALLDNWYFKKSSATDFSKANSEFLFYKDEILKGTRERAGLKSSNINLWPRIMIAASLVGVMVLGGLYINQRIRNEQLEQDRAYALIKPGKNTATLTLGNGRKIILDEQGIGEVARETGIKISMNKNGDLIYMVLDQKLSAQNIMNTLSTANGETKKVVLPDGTNVWLNAASSITYSTSMTVAQKREVSLIGEAYFEAAHDKDHPFVVSSKGQDVEVLGTHFDISAYEDDFLTKTTLLEGSVQVKGEKAVAILLPGQQATLLNSGMIDKKAVNVAGVVDWKNGFFTFDDERLERMMDNIGRWYNVKVVFEDAGLKGMNVYGRFSRFENLQKMLKALELSGELKFDLQNSILTIKKP